MFAMVRVCRFGLMAHSTKATGVETKLTAAEDLSTLMVMYMRANGKMIKLTDSGNTIILMELVMKVTGGRTSNMVMARKPGPTAHVTRANIKMERKMVLESLTGQTVPPIRVNS